MSIGKINRRKIVIGVLVLLFLCMTMTCSITIISSIIFPPIDPPSGSGSYGSNGPFGTTGSDGECWYWNDPETGASIMNCPP